MSGVTGAVDAQQATTHEALGDGYQAVRRLSANTAMAAITVAKPASRFLHAGHRARSPLVPSRAADVGLAPACCVLGEWIVVLDGERLRRARARAGLTRKRLAAESTVGLSTIGRLEGQPQSHCHFRTRARLAMALGTRPKALTADSTSHPEARGSGLLQASLGLAQQQASARTFPARPDQVAQARAFVSQVLGDTPITADAVLVCSELTTNAVLHSASAQPGGCFTVRAEVRPGDHAWIEVHDQGGRWVHLPRASGGRGLGMVDELATHWDIRGDDTGRTICAQLNWRC
jgi:serine/threonine-protein kinase RsbW